jgi:hypothetical protein
VSAAGRFSGKAGLLLAAACLALAGSVHGAVNSVASLADPLDNNGGGARAEGMGSAFVGVADDAETLLWNPAGLGLLPTAELELDHNSWIAGILQETGIITFPAGELGGFGLDADYVNYGTLNSYDENGNQTGVYSPYRFGLGAGWGKELLPGFSAGLSLNGSTQDIDGSSYSDLSGNLGALWCPMPNLRIGLAYNNLGTQVAGYALDSSLNGGASYRFDLTQNNRLLLTGAASWEPQGVNRLQVGAEDTIQSTLALRIGYQDNLATTDISGLAGLSAGLGLILGGLTVDYAFVPYGDLGDSNRISLGYKFGP